MSKAIMDMYRHSGVPESKWPKRNPDGTRGRGIHTRRAHQAVLQYLKKGMSKQEAWKRVQGGMGKYAIKPEHRRKE